MGTSDSEGPPPSREDWEVLIAALRAARVPIDPGLTNAEAAGVEQEYGFRFPPDLRDLLQVGLPVGPGFPDWRSGDRAGLRERMDAPLAGLWFDVEVNDVWPAFYGERPRDLTEARRVLEGLVRRAPRLVPVHAHRYVPGRPGSAGNPVFSVHQSDIIHYAPDLRSFLNAEFRLGLERPVEQAGRARAVEFWSAFDTGNA